ncbi:MAG: putative sugar nucleotidyl transferase [Candidatus Margulisiibacteriota bacterium]
MNHLIQVCIFEDDVAKGFSPYQLTRPIYTLPNGMYNLVEKIQATYKDAPLTLLCQPHHEIFLKRRFPKVAINQLNKSLPTLFINGRFSFTQAQFHGLLNEINYQKNNLFVSQKSIAAIYSNDSQLEPIFNALLKQPSFDSIVAQFRNYCQVKEKKHLQTIEYWWELINHFSNNIVKDFELFDKRSLIEGDVSSFAILTKDNDMYIDANAKVSEYVSLDASKGPIIIMDHVTIEPFTRIEGPCFIGSNTIIHAHAHIARCYIGKSCKIGGELKNSIFQSYSNKGHFGFVGDSIIGEWVNLGAGTTTSNLKLSYGEISSFQNGTTTPIKTKMQFLGSLFGDFVKTSIQSKFDCGSVIGNACSLFGSDPHAKLIPSFTWGKCNHYEHQNIGSFIHALGRVMKRRNLALSEEESLRLKRIYDDYRKLNVIA